MFSLTKKPYNLFLVAAVILTSLLVLRLVKVRTKSSEFLTPQIVLLWTIPIVLIIFWLLYLSTKKFLFSNLLLWIHVLVTILTVAYVTQLLENGINIFQNLGRRYADFQETTAGRETNAIIGIIAWTLMVGQLTYILNIILGLIKGKERNNS